MIDLFGNKYTENDLIQSKSRSFYQRFRGLNKYRKSDSDNRCKNCVHLVRKNYHNKNYYKCEHQGFSSCSASDIRLNHICNLYIRGDK
jgi:hypothetical protein